MKKVKKEDAKKPQQERADLLPFDFNTLLNFVSIKSQRDELVK
jgi:hypothetical protein